MRLARITIIVLSILLAISCSRHPTWRAQGYVEGRYTYIATSAAGILTDLTVDRGAKVSAGDTLFTLDQQPESDKYKAAQDSMQQAVAGRNAISANLEFAKLTYQRYQILVPKKAIDQSSLDNARSRYNSTMQQLTQANASIAEANAVLAQAQWSLNQKTVKAPVDGIVFDTFYRRGEYVEASKPVLSMLAPENIKVIFYISEANLGSIQLGDKVTIHCDGGEQDQTGRISFISPTAEYTPPVIYSTETNAKLIFRIEASFAPDQARLLHPGQPVTVTWTRYE